MAFYFIKSIPDKLFPLRETGVNSIENLSRSSYCGRIVLKLHVRIIMYFLRIAFFVRNLYLENEWFVAVSIHACTQSMLGDKITDFIKKRRKKKKHIIYQQVKRSSYFLSLSHDFVIMLKYCFTQLVIEFQFSMFVIIFTSVIFCFAYKIIDMLSVRTYLLELFVFFFRYALKFSCFFLFLSLSFCTE